MNPSLGSDNHSGIHPLIMEAIIAANVGHSHSYGLDDISKSVSFEWTRVLGREAHVFYVFNGTGANVLALQSLVKPFEAVAAGDQSHLHLDECGAPDRSFKLFVLPSTDGRISPQQLRDILARSGDQHFSQLKAVSLTLPTELGVCYSLDELAQWRKFADEHRLFIHWDGARLSNFASHYGCGFDKLIQAGRPDAISFGGTKNGLMGAEAVILFDSDRAKDFKFIRKQGLQLSSKTRFLAAQFQAYLKNDLWKEIAGHVTSEARFLEGELLRFPKVKVEHPVQSNAIFVQLPKAWIHPLRENFFFYIWDMDKNLARWMISFDWRREYTERLLSKIEEVAKQWPT